MVVSVFSPFFLAFLFSQISEVTHVEIKEEIRVVEAITAALGQEIEMANKWLFGNFSQLFFFELSCWKVFVRTSVYLLLFFFELLLLRKFTTVGCWSSDLKVSSGGWSDCFSFTKSGQSFAWKKLRFPSYHCHPRVVTSSTPWSRQIVWQGNWNNAALTVHLGMWTSCNLVASTKWHLGSMSSLYKQKADMNMSLKKAGSAKKTFI